MADTSASTTASSAVDRPVEPGEERILAGLSEAQRVAVVHGEGPLLIVAGAGTGKTTVLTRRIAHLITSKRARPEEILALTFTEKAAVEMAERVDQLIPYGCAETRIATLHAFGDRLLRESALEIGLDPHFRVLGRPEQVIFLRERSAACSRRASPSFRRRRSSGLAARPLPSGLRRVPRRGYREYCVTLALHKGQVANAGDRRIALVLPTLLSVRPRRRPLSLFD